MPGCKTLMPICAKPVTVFYLCMYLCMDDCFLELFFFSQADVDNDIKLLTHKNEEISEVVTKLEANSDKLDIDEAVVTTAPLYNQ